MPKVTLLIRFLFPIAMRVRSSYSDVAFPYSVLHAPTGIPQKPREIRPPESPAKWGGGTAIAPPLGATGQNMQPAPILVENVKLAQITDLAYNGEADTNGITAGIPFFEPLK